MRGAALLLALALAGCSTTPSTYSVPPYVGADCITKAGHLVKVTGAMPGGWWWVKGDLSAPWMVPTAELARCI